MRDILDLDQAELPDYTTIYKSFDRLKMWVWRALLRVSAQQPSSKLRYDSSTISATRAN
jgi:IS5 family transposase